MKDFLIHARSYILRGFLAIIPIFLCILAIQLLYNLIDKKVIEFLNNFVEVRQIPGFGILLLLLSLYFIGMVVGNFIGHQFFAVLERISKNIPIIGAIYNVGKQLSHSLSISSSETKAFKKVVLVRIGDTGLLSPGFINGEVFDQRTQEKLLVVLVPTAPTPASGFVVLMKPSQVIDPGWSIEEGLKALVSMGIITPKEVKNL